MILTRRRALSYLGSAAALTLSPVKVGAALRRQLVLHGPPAGPSVTLAYAVASDRFASIATDASFVVWRNPDELRAGLTSGTIQLSVVPIQMAANLYNRGFPLRLANVMTQGLLYVIAEDPEINAIADLSGRKVAVPFRGDTPEILFGLLLDHNALDAQSDLDITYAGTPIEAMQLLLAGRVDAALTAEPSTSAGILGGQLAGKQIRRAIDMQVAWGEMTDAAPVVPQAGLALTEEFLDNSADVVPELMAVVETATREVLSDPSGTVTKASPFLGLPAPILSASVPHSKLVAVPAAEARADIERMLSAMGGKGLKRIGGRLPDDEFYL